MAQCISALTRITNTIKGRTPLPGFILSVMEFKADVCYLKNNTTIQMKAVEDFRDEENHVYRYICELYANKNDEKPVVTTKVSVMETEDAEALFGGN
jgi:predicted hotdog family 3-hydroxylacyl-ACP dehydratase